jgi:glycosyltransferase involved in cell wall biosynthesis
MKILYNFLFWGEPKGGINRASLKLLYALEAACPGEVFCLTNYEEMVQDFPEERRIIHHFKSRSKILKAVEVQGVFRKIIRQIRPDVILNSIHFGYLGNFNNQMTVVMDLIPLTAATKNPLGIFYFKFLLKRLVSRCRVVLVPSKATRSDLTRIFKTPAEKIEVIPLGADLRLFREKAERKGDHYLIVNASFPYKNIDFVLDCWERSDLREKLVIIGKNFHFPEYFNRLRERTRQLGLEDRVTFHEKVSDEELAGFYQDCRALIFPSLKEGFGLPALEALACGAPVILSRIPVFEELFGPAAIFFEPGNQASFLKSLESLEKMDPLVFEEERSKILEKYTWEKAAEQIRRITRRPVLGSGSCVPGDART